MKDTILAADAAPVVLDGPVLNEDMIWWHEGGFSAVTVRGALQAAGPDAAVTFVINSPGGDPFEGEAIRAALVAHEGRVTMRVAGVAASAASLLIMGADAIEITEGSMIMIHDPATLTFGDAADHERALAQLETMSGTYATVYAKRSGQPVAEVRDWMRAETWMSPEDAIRLGFADELAETPAEANASMSAAPDQSKKCFREMREAFAAAAMQGRPGFQWAAGGSRTPEQKEGVFMSKGKDGSVNPKLNAPEGGVVAGAGGIVGERVTEEVVPATDGALPVTMAAPSSPAPQAPDAEAIRAEERTRVMSIRDMARPFMASGQLTEVQVDAEIAAGTTADAAGARFMALMAAAEPAPVQGGARAHITRDATDTEREGLVGALMGQREGPAAQFSGMRTLKHLALHLAGPSRNFNDAQSVRAGMSSVRMMGGAHGVSDFAAITAEVMGRSLLAEYDRRAANWQLVTGRPLTATDFRELAPVRFGGDLTLKTVKDNGEYEEATLADEAEGLKVERRGRTLNITFEAVINDDMGAFDRLPREFAMAARMMESTIVWGLIRSNAVLKSDSKALFHTDHANLASSGAAISATTVGNARKAMWEQTAYGSTDKDDFIMVEPNLLIVPPAQEIKAKQFLMATVPAKDSDANPYKDSLTGHTVPHLSAAAGGSDTAWYLISDDLPPISHAFLEGYEAPTVSVTDGMNPDKTTLNARHIFGAAATEFRGAWKNPGA